MFHHFVRGLNKPFDFCHFVAVVLFAEGGVDDTGRIAKTKFSATQRCNIFAILFQMAVILSLHFNAALRQIE